MIPRLGRVTTILAGGVLVLAVLATAQPTDPFVGIWRLNLAKSKYSPGPAPKSVTATYEMAGPGYKVSVRAEPASGPGRSGPTRPVSMGRIHRSQVITPMRTRWR